MGEIVLADDLWGVLGLVVTSVGTVLVTLLTARAKRGSDREDQRAAPVIERAEASTNLQAVVDALVDQMMEVRAELECLKPIAREKYPAAIHHIRLLHSLNPEGAAHVPPQIREDL